MIWHELTLIPRDLLFFRDARPMAGGSAGRGDQWPLPQTLHGALLSSLLAHWPERQSWETAPSEWKNSRLRDCAPRFGELRSVGPFPALGTDLLVPTPRDLVPEKEENPASALIGYAPLQPPAGAVSNLPSALLYPVTRTQPPSKINCPPWIRLSELAKYLAGQNCETTKASELMDSECAIGIAIDPDTGTTEEGKLYNPRKLRLRPGVSLRAYLSLPAKDAACAPIDEWAAAHPSLLFGGETATVRVESRRRLDAAPWKNPPTLPPAPVDPTRIKWTLLTPAIFRHGWKPGWIDDQGQVQLPREKTSRLPGESRADWRKRIQAESPSIKARLVSALVPSPRSASGWSLPHEGPKATQRLVDAGSVYYFQADSAEDADALRRALHGHCRSDHLGEKGYGLGLCSYWNFSPEIPA